MARPGPKYTIASLSILDHSAALWHQAWCQQRGGHWEIWDRPGEDPDGVLGDRWDNLTLMLEVGKTQCRD
jgi:hypothetical protein